MFSHVTKIKNACVALVSALLCTGAVILGCTVPVFASNNTYPYTESRPNITCYLYFGDSNASIYSSTGDVCIPLYVYYTADITIDYNYLSGYYTFNKPNIQFTTGGNVIIPSYFEPVTDANIQINYPNDGYSRCMLFFDNHYAIAGTGYAHIIGYFHFTPNNTSTLNITPSNTNILVSPIYQHIECTTAPDGFVNAMTQAIVTAYNDNQIFEILDNIGVNSGYLPAIFTNLQTNHNALYQLITNLWNTDKAILSVNTDTYNTVLSILALLNNAYGTQESEAANIADDINTGLNNLSHDIAITAPSAVADISDNYIQQIDTTYNSNIFGFLSNSWIILMLCLVFSFAILSYMLYGGS